MEFKIDKIEQWEKTRNQMYSDKEMTQELELRKPHYLDLMRRISEQELWREHIERQHDVVSSTLRRFMIHARRTEQRNIFLERRYKTLERHLIHQLEEIRRSSFIKNRDFLASFFMIVMGVMLFSLGFIFKFHPFMQLGLISLFIVTWDLLIRRREK